MIKKKKKKRKKKKKKKKKLKPFIIQALLMAVPSLLLGILRKSAFLKHF